MTNNRAGKPFVEFLKENNIIPGIKVDKVSCSIVKGRFGMFSKSVTFI
jgi:fructose-bisphosphate aldolase class 1